jgi:hypothetical protein
MQNRDMKIQTAIQRRARDVVVFTPPRKVALANYKLEHETNCEPGRVIDASRGRYERDPEQHDGRAHKLGP